ncbi:hypothetical protein RCL1_002899 [Eukaryota sp. TZLM3-RCL]
MPSINFLNRNVILSKESNFSPFRQHFLIENPKPPGQAFPPWERIAVDFKKREVEDEDYSLDDVLQTTPSVDLTTLKDVFTSMLHTLEFCNSSVRVLFYNNDCANLFNLSIVSDYFKSCGHPTFFIDGQDASKLATSLLVQAVFEHYEVEFNRNSTLSLDFFLRISSFLGRSVFYVVVDNINLLPFKILEEIIHLCSLPQIKLVFATTQGGSLPLSLVSLLQPVPFLLKPMFSSDNSVSPIKSSSSKFDEFSFTQLLSIDTVLHVHVHLSEHVKTVFRLMLEAAVKVAKEKGFDQPFLPLSSVSKVKGLLRYFHGIDNHILQYSLHGIIRKGTHEYGSSKTIGYLFCISVSNAELLLAKIK